MTVEESNEIAREADEWSNSPLRLATSNLITTLILYCDKMPLNSPDRAKRLAESFKALNSVQYELIGELEELGSSEVMELKF